MATESAELLRVACLRDNFAWLIHDPLTGATACVDVPEAAPIMAALHERGWRLSHILLTHHHDDHICGVAPLSGATGAKVAGARADSHRLPPLDQELAEGDVIEIGALAAHVIEVPGHTSGHIAFHFPDVGMAFTGDSLMGLGCGRLFEGSPAEMWQSLSKLAALPAQTLIGSGHDYGRSNSEFALSVDPDNPDLQARAARIHGGEICVPERLSEELATNPFLRADQPALRATTGLPDAPAAEVFAALRAMKDNF